MIVKPLNSHRFILRKRYIVTNLSLDHDQHHNYIDDHDHDHDHDHDYNDEEDDDGCEGRTMGTAATFYFVLF